MDRILKICFCVILIGIYWIAIADSFVCNEVRYFGKCKVCAEDKSCPKCSNTIPNIECRQLDSTCRCMRGFGRKGGLCVRATTIAKYGDDCDDNNRLCDSADDYLSCELSDFRGTPSKCICSYGYYRDEVAGQCISGTGVILDVCSANTCRQIPALKCDKSLNRCLVQKGYKYNCETKDYDKGTKEHNQTCDEDSCSLAQPGCDPCNPDKYLECKNRACDCRSGYTWVPNQGECIAGTQQPGAACDNITNQCDPNGHLECEDGFCVCIEEYVLDDTRCVELPTHDEDCSNFLCDPIDPNMVCNPATGKCECKEGYEYHTVLKKCVRYREYNETCEQDIPCNPKSNLECINRTLCDCKEGLFEYDEDEKLCVICVEDEGLTVEDLIGILVFVYLGVLGEVGLIVWLVRQHRRVRPVDTEQERQGSSPPEGSKGRRNTKSKRRSTQIKKERQGSLHPDEFKGREDTKRRSTQIKIERQGSLHPEEFKGREGTKRRSTQIKE